VNDEGYAIKETLAMMEGGELGNGVSFLGSYVTILNIFFFPFDKRNFLRMQS
jgi:hypothetical protein